MQKPNALRVTLLISALCCITKLALDIFFIIDTHLSFYAAALSGDGEAVMPTDIKAFLIILSVLSTLPIGIIAAVNYAKTDLLRRRGIATTVTTGVFYSFYMLGAVLTASLLKSVIGRFYGSSELALAEKICVRLCTTNFLVHAAAVMVFCCAAVEIYGGKASKK
ncbi:hypothetical protein [Ruminococcus sp.]|uniref:hypothetical protein n=1 Tax=Ruminococcus sp. TaxID=41978 RepID=UPI002B8A730F|nr:hypothetical protein [Ruminococcus sp.]HOA00221.1 hypothetical protein [Ruminococcus sp.]HOH87662.1 hypothetical protein [Ruminococcus sp.]